MVVKESGELASPPTGGVTVCGTFTPIPVGAAPTQDTAKLTGLLNPPSEFTITLVPPLIPGIVDTVSADGLMEKSPPFTGVTGVTGARTVGVLPIMTGISVEWEITPFVAVTSRV